MNRNVRLAVLGAAVVLERRIARKVTVKSVDSVVIGYRDDLTRDFLNVLDGRISLPEAERRHRRYIERDAQSAYLEGLTEGGVEADEMDADDRRAINAWKQSQGAYVAGLWEAVGDYRKARRGMERDERTAGQRDLFERIGLWAKSLEALASEGRASAQANAMGEWVYDAEKEHCDDCRELHGTRHRLKWFTSRGFYPQRPGAAMACGGWKCGCKIKSIKTGKVLLPA